MGGWARAWIAGLMLAALAAGPAAALAGDTEVVGASVRVRPAVRWTLTDGALRIEANTRWILVADTGHGIVEIRGDRSRLQPLPEGTTSVTLVSE